VRDRSRSPAERRSRDTASSRGGRDSYSRRDYGYSRNSYDRKDSYDTRSRGGYSGRSSYRGRGSYASSGSYGGARGGSSYRGSSRGRSEGRDFSSRRDYSSSSSAPADETYRAKTERNFDNSIFIGNIPFDCTSKEIEDIFEGRFDIIRADIVTNRGKSRGMATVEFATKDDVRQAIEKFDHYDFRGRQIFVRQDYPPPEKKEEFRNQRRERDSYRSEYPPKRTDYRDEYSQEDYRERRQEVSSIPKPGTEIFVGNLPFSVNWQALKDIMREAGEVTRADVRLDNWGKSRGFGTVVFSTAEAATKAIEMFQGYEIEGRKLDTRPGKTSANYNNSRSRDEDYQSTKPEPKPFKAKQNSDFTNNVEGNGERSDEIYVSNLPFVTNNEDLYELFETVGRVVKAEVQYTDIGKASGNAVVQFELAETADTAIQNLDNYVYGGRPLSITFAKRPEKTTNQDVDVDIEVEENPDSNNLDTKHTNVDADVEANVEANVDANVDADVDVDVEIDNNATSD
jgi:RNA recognition motif-containing protein